MKKLSMLLVALAMFIVGCGGEKQSVSDKLQVAASFYPMAEFARNVAGDKAEVFVLVPDGAEAHDWEPSPSDLSRLGKAQVFVYNGVVEPWAKQALTALSERKILAVQTGLGLYERAGETHEEEHHHHDHGCAHGKQDPHVWISPKKAIKQVERITAVLCEADAKNAKYYQDNSAKYVEQLKALDIQLTNLAKNAPRKVFVTAHAAFGHLADDYGLKQLAVNGLSPHAEPTPADLQRLIKVVQEENVRYVFFETLTDPKLAKLVADETGAEISVLDPLEGLNEEGRKNKLDYLQIMQRNIHNLQIALNAK
ncbi:MAG: zinc ABC transporter substrate-binding protein [Phascolarctobacterium sp.]|jgi:zinc transport system substrate-binding protein|nr:zinc ABC transporter substrate-binding protein [Phascolarctobacterium sp.]MBQ2135151.1 zinc ABC transporter substrate-binding protein [Phascolarctobacterium sp.]